MQSHFEINCLNALLLAIDSIHRYLERKGNRKRELDNMAGERQRCGAGFTLMELLAVVAIVALIVTIFVPLIMNAIEKARQVKCKSNLRTIGMAMISFADDHDGRLPGSYGEGLGDSNDPEWGGESYMGREVVNDGSSSGVDPGWDEYGAILEYLPVSKGDAGKIYRCQSHKKGGNGMFDYTMLESLGGVMLGRIPTRAVIYRGKEDRRRQVGTPLVIEEISVQEGSSIDPGFSGPDRMGVWHRGDKGFYCTVEGNIESIEGVGDPAEGPSAMDWEVEVRREWKPIGVSGSDFGDLPWDD